MQQGIINASHINSWINNYIEYDNNNTSGINDKVVQKI